jgi:hypothetical protein
MIQTGGGGNDPEFLKWLFIRILLALPWAILKYGVRKAGEAIKKRADVLLRAARRP